MSKKSSAWMHCDGLDASISRAKRSMLAQKTQVSRDPLGRVHTDKMKKQRCGCEVSLLVFVLQNVPCHKSACNPRKTRHIVLITVGALEHTCTHPQSISHTSKMRPQNHTVSLETGQEYSPCQQGSNVRAAILQGCRDCIKICPGSWPSHFALRERMRLIRIFLHTRAGMHMGHACKHAGPQRRAEAAWNAPCSSMCGKIAGAKAISSWIFAAVERC
jgi:hypothetical protein